MVTGAAALHAHTHTHTSSPVPSWAGWRPLGPCRSGDTPAHLRAAAAQPAQAAQVSQAGCTERQAAHALAGAAVPLCAHTRVFVLCWQQHTAVLPHSSLQAETDGEGLQGLSHRYFKCLCVASARQYNMLCMRNTQALEGVAFVSPLVALHCADSHLLVYHTRPEPPPVCCTLATHGAH